MGDVGRQCVALLDQQLGPDYISGEQEFRALVDQPGWRLYVHEQVEPAGRDSGSVIHSATSVEDLPAIDIAGFFVVGTVDQDELRRQTCIDGICRALPYDADEFPVTLLKMKVVRPSWEGRGVGWRLGVAALEHYGDAGPYVGTLLDRATDDREGHIQNLEKIGGRAVHRFEHANPPGYRCASCGLDAECRCDLLLYVVDGATPDPDRQPSTAGPHATESHGSVGTTVVKEP